MQTVSAALQTELNKGKDEPRILLDLYEFYASSYVPGATGFDPASAIEKFAAETITWNAIAYRREVVSRSDVVRNMGEKTNQVTLTFSNISRYMATLAQSQTIEGLFLVIRCVSPTVTDDSIVLFIGRCDKPSDIDKEQFTLPARQDFGNINQTLPPDKFVTEDPNGRLPGDLLFEGFRFTAISGSFTRTETKKFLFIFKKKKKVTEQWSALDETPYGNPVTEVFGSCQIQGIPLVFQDRGTFTLGMWVWSKGPISSIANFAVKSDGRIVTNTVNHLGDLGGTGSNATEDTLQAPGIGYLSLTAYTSASFTSSVDVVDDAPTVVALIRGRLIDIPNSSGVFNVTAWSDNPVNIARYILTNSKFVNIPSGFMEDAVNYQTSLHCDEPIIDETNDQVILIPTPDLPDAGTDFHRYRSTGELNPRYFRFNYLGDTSIIPEVVDGPYTGYSTTNYPTFFATQKLLRKRYTANFPITDEVRAVDLLYKTVFPSFKGFLRVNKKGKYEIRTEKANDSTRLRGATAVGATSVPVLDVTPWKSGPDLLTGRIYAGVGLTTSEVRDVSTADYSTSGNSVTLAASATGGVTATASGATLTGGSTTVQASGTITIGGTPAAGNTVTATIDGIAVVYTLTSEDTTGTTAAMLASYINATPKLNKYIKTTWASGTPTIITIKCLHGALNVTALLKAHGGPIVDPLVAPTTAAAAGGALAAGTWQVAYSDVTAVGSTALTPVSPRVVTLNQKIDLSALPALVGTSRNFYLSDQAGSTNLRFVVNRTDAANFSITAAPLPGAALPPSSNTTAEELIRIAMSFATNSQDVYSVWPASTLVILNDIYLPTVPNSHKYQVTTEGTTAATEPTWPLTAGGTVASGTAIFTEIGATVLGQAGLTRANIKKDSFKWPQGSTQSSVNQIKISFRDRKNDFALTPYRVNDKVHQLQVKKIYPLEIDGSAIDNFHQMNRIANWQLSKNREGDWFNSLETGPGGLPLEEGDVICASDDSGGLINVPTRIEELRIKPNHDVSIARARKYSTLMFSDDVGASTVPVPTTLRFSETVSSIVEFIDNFPIHDADGLTPGFYVAVSRDLAVLGDWRGWVLWADYGDGYVKIASGDLPAVMGTATTTLATVTDASVWDRTSSLTFTLKYGQLSPSPVPFATVTEEQLRANSRRNLFLVGNEYVQAATVVYNGGQSYTISILLRGRFGTDGTELTHGASERVVFLDGAEQFVAIDPVRLNGAFNYKAVTTNQDVTAATAVPFTWTGGTVKAMHPSNLRGARDTGTTPTSGADLLIQFDRVTRVGGGLRSYSDVPIAEEKEEYLVTIPSAVPVRTMTVLPGTQLAGFLIPSSLLPTVSDAECHHNTLDPVAIDAARNVTARTIQEIPIPASNFVEGTLQGGNAGSVSAIGLQQAGGAWRTIADTLSGLLPLGATLTGLTTLPYLVVLEYVGAGYHRVGVYEYGVRLYSASSLNTESDYDSKFGWPAAEGSSHQFRIRLMFVGSSVRIQKADVIGSSFFKTLATGKVATNNVFPMFVVTPTVSPMLGGGAVQSVTMTTYPQVATIYSAAQQIQDGFAANTAPITVRASALSKVIGPGPYNEKAL